MHTFYEKLLLNENLMKYEFNLLKQAFSNLDSIDVSCGRLVVIELIYVCTLFWNRWSRGSLDSQ